CDSSGDLYPVTQPSLTLTPHALLSVSTTTWHQRLGHPGEELGKHVRLLFSSFNSIVSRSFEIVHSDIWTSPIVSSGGFKYYVLFLDHYSHYLWIYPLRAKSEMFQKFLHFRSYVNNQFKSDISAFQCNHGGEFENNNLLNLFSQNGIQMRFSCPKTSQQNRKSKRMIRTINNVIRTLLFQAHLPPSFWVEALHMAAYLLNILPSSAIQNDIPCTKLFNKQPDYSRLRIFGCLCYPHLYSPYKLAPQATPYAMHDEYNALIKNGTWILVPKPPIVNVVWSMWLFRHKHHADGSLSRYKAHLVANGRNQQYGVDCSDTFSLVVKPATICIVLSLALAQNWHVHQLDVKNAFLNGDLTETVYMYQPPGFVDSCFPHHHGTEVAYLLIYVDDIVLTASSTALLQCIISSLHKELDMTDLGALNYFLGISVARDARGMFLFQKKYAMELLGCTHMLNCNATRTPVDTESKLGFDGDPICLHMHDPREPHLAALKRVLRYIRGTLDHGLQLHVSSTSQLNAYTDADWAGCPVTRRSTSSYCVFLRDNLLSWSAKRKVTLSRSSAKAEYHGVANVVVKTA
ncbi:ribonuclease H-like domain-containing protein, partial [Tanacetum coccineum]